MKDTVKFVDMGKMYTADEAETFVATWRKAMDKSKQLAGGRSPAPKRSAFAGQLADIDPGLMARLDERASYQPDDDRETDKDARDIVRKAGYLEKMSNTRPEYALKYIMSKCDVLADYGVIPEGLPKAAAKFAKLVEDEAKKSAISKAGAELVAQINLCPARFRVPLGDALLRRPMIGRERPKSELKRG